MSEFNEMLENRLVKHSASILQLVDLLPRKIVGRTLADQLARCGLSFTLNYGEARAAESRRDFIHKTKLVLKELRETLLCLRVIACLEMPGVMEKVLFLKKETNELVSMFVKSVQTAEKNYNERGMK